MASVLVDTGIWIALFSEKLSDDRRAELDIVYELISLHTIVVPWPVAYETLRTSFVRNREAIRKFEKEMRSPRIVMLDDALYKQRALEMALTPTLRDFRNLSMVDCVLRLMMDDPNVKVNVFATLNPGDFYDVCQSRQIEMIP